MRRLGDEHPVRHPDDPPRLAQDDLDLARVAVESLGELDRLGPGFDAVRSTTAPSAFETTFCVTTRTSSSRRGSAPGVPAIASPMSPGRSSPRRTSGMPSSARTEIEPGVGRPPPSTVGQPTPSRSGAVDSTKTRSSGVSRSMVSGPSELDVADAGGLGERPMGGPAAGPEGDVDDVGRSEAEGVGARPVPVGDEDDGRRRPRAGPRRARRWRRRSRTAGRPAGPGSPRRHRPRRLARLRGTRR